MTDLTQVLPGPGAARVGAVVIGRNEGPRLAACLASLRAEAVAPLVYVDSGSTDDSLGIARSAGAEVVVLDPTVPFTAARARNAGFAQLTSGPDAPPLVMFIDGDCELVPGFLPQATGFLDAHPEVVAVAGRRRERFPDASVYNRQCEDEWNTPPGPGTPFGGDVLMRSAALAAAGGYRDSLIAGEEPELALRLRRAGGEIWRIDSDMTRHDAAMHRFGQWWARSVRAGHAFAEGAALHGHGPERHYVRETRRALLWGLVLPLPILLLALLDGDFLILALIYPLQFLRLARRMGPQAAGFSLLGKFAEATGALRYWLNRLRARQSRIIEYK